MFIHADQLYQTLVELVGIPSISGQEAEVRTYLEHHLALLGLKTHVDTSGNLIATIDGEGTPLLLNAHMDRVPPGLGHTPVLHEGILYSDGHTNLGADDAAGITIILEVLRRVTEQQLPIPPLVILFTVQEETGLCGAHNFDSATLNVANGIVFDNAFEAGVIVSKGAAYEAFTIVIHGKSGHPGKDLTGTVDAIEIFRQAHFPSGPQAGDLTRINIGKISSGSARNAIAGSMIIEGEIRSFESADKRQQYKAELQEAFELSAQRLGGRIEITFETHNEGYSISPDEPLLQVYQAVLAERGDLLTMQPTFIGSDTGGFRPQIKAFTLSTGVVNEHTKDEYVALAPLEQIVIDTLYVLHQWRALTAKDLT
jgi:tripeptide aminopeptidase